MNIIGFYIIVVFVIFVASKSKKKSKTENRTSYTTAAGSKATGARPKTAADRSRETVRINAAQRARASRNNGEYDAESLAFCESQLAPGKGISFHGLRPGTDELALLVKRNHMREKELEKALHGEHHH